MTITFSTLEPQWAVVTPMTRWIGTREEAEQRYAVLTGLGIETVMGPWIADRMWALA